ncbi:MAG TPA: hypothetical protein VGT44_09205 [Ktedonobacteraceae bacterium]|nr:hypothetical protein [Ktedonobacteraceae bacterium]
MLSLARVARFPVKRLVLSSAFLLLAFASMFANTQVQARGKTSPPGKEINPATVMGVQVNGPSSLPGISWVRLGYATCGAGDPSGAALQGIIDGYHRHGVHVLLTVCQPKPAHLLDTGYLNDAAQANPDAVQCGNEEMKGGAYNIYISPQLFAAFYDLCQKAVHAVNPSAVIVLGSLDPHVARYDTQLLLGEVNYLNAMQEAMNARVYKHGHWTWRSQIVGLINSWHDGYPSLYINNLRDLYTFWAWAFHVDMNQLGNHLWVVEDTGCFKGCGVPDNQRQIAIAHILALIVDVRVTMEYRVPFFFFSARDFFASGAYWPIGILNNKGQPKPLRQDLPMGSRSLLMSCGKLKTRVITQEQLLATMYYGCQLPENSYNTLIY